MLIYFDFDTHQKRLTSVCSSFVHSQLTCFFIWSPPSKPLVRIFLSSRKYKVDKSNHECVYGGCIYRCIRQINFMDKDLAAFQDASNNSHLLNFVFKIVKEEEFLVFKSI